MPKLKFTTDTIKRLKPPTDKAKEQSNESLMRASSCAGKLVK